MVEEVDVLRHGDFQVVDGAFHPAHRHPIPLKQAGVVSSQERFVGRSFVELENGFEFKNLRCLDEA